MRTRQIIVTAAVLTLVVVLLILAVYWAPLDFLRLSHTEKPSWSDFGTYAGGVLGPVVALANLGIVLFIAIRVTELQQNRLAAKRLSIDLLNEWHSETLHASRIYISDRIDGYTKYPRPLSELERSFPEESEHAFRIFHFFERWATLSYLGEVDERILNESLGERAKWWNEQFFAPLRGVETDKHIFLSLHRIKTLALE